MIVARFASTYPLFSPSMHYQAIDHSQMVAASKCGSIHRFGMYPNQWHITVHVRISAARQSNHLISSPINFTFNYRAIWLAWDRSAWG